MDLLIIFVSFFVVSYVLYYFLIVRKNKVYNPDKVPQEIIFLKNKYQLELEKINYPKLLKLIALVNSLILATTVVLVGFVNGLVMQVFVAFLILFPLVFIVYTIIGKSYQKKGKRK